MDPTRGSWWREIEVFGLVALVVVAYALRAGDLPLRGEEPTRVQMAYEMAERHDWLVPRQQGEPLRVRPPLQGWAIAACCSALGDWSERAVRLPSVVATLLTTLLVYAYSRNFLARLGALAAAVAFATFADWFQMGLQAETEALFTLLVSASLLVWHHGLTRGWPDAVTFSAGYALMALATLTKGVQAPVYFLGAIFGYLLLTGQWRRLFRVGHLVGVVVGAGILLAWIIPYAQVMGWDEALFVWTGDPAVVLNGRVSDWNGRQFTTHLLTFPLEIAGGTLPWSLLLLCYLWPTFRASIGAARPCVAFLAVCLAVAFPTCWIPPGGLPRYFAPLLPCVAVLIGLAVQRCAEADAASAAWRAWKRFLAASALAIAGAGIGQAVVSACFIGHAVLGPLAEPPLVAAGYVLASLALAALLWRARGDHGRARGAVVALAAFLTLTFAGVVHDCRARKSESPAEAMRSLLDRIPPDQPLVSLGRAHPLFVYHYRRPLPACAWPESADAPCPDTTYFCFLSPGDSRPSLPFAWEEVGTFPLDRNRRPVPAQVMVVGRRLWATPPATEVVSVPTTER